MEFEWDEAKSAANLAKHGIDFGRASTIWRRRVIDPISVRMVGDERRGLAIGVIGEDDLVIAVVYTLRNGICRLISARRGRRDERTRYKSEFGHGT
jgi:uncharacterized DUF497 family protein